MKQDFPYKVIKGGKAVAQASTLAEARAEAKRCGGVAVAGRGYAKRNPKTERQKLEDLVWSNTHRDFRGKFADGTKTISMFVPKVGTTLVPLSQLTDAQLREQLPQGMKQRNPSSGAKQRARGTRSLKGETYAQTSAGDRASQEAREIRKQIAGYKQRAAVPLSEAWGSFSGPRALEHVPALKGKHKEALTKARSHHPKLPNPSEAHHLKEATLQLQYAQNLSQRANAADVTGKVKDARSLWAQTLETASAAYENAMGLPTEQGSALRQAARKLREQAYNYLVK